MRRKGRCLTRWGGNIQHSTFNVEWAGSSSNQIRLQRLAFLELAHAHDTETDDMACRIHAFHDGIMLGFLLVPGGIRKTDLDRKSTRLNSSHLGISYAV